MPHLNFLLSSIVRLMGFFVGQGESFEEAWRSLESIMFLSTTIEGLRTWEVWRGSLQREGGGDM